MVNRLAPVHFVAGGLVLGLCLSLAWRPPLATVVALLAAASLTLVAGRGSPAGRPPAGALLVAAALLLASVTLGVALGGLRVASVGRSELRPLIGSRGQIEVVLLDLPEGRERGVSVPAQVTAFDGRPVHGKALVQLAVDGERPDWLLDPCGELTEGAFVHLGGARIERLPAAPAGGFDYGRYLARRGIHVVVEARLADATVGGRRGGLLGLLDRLRVAARRTVQRGLPAPQRDILRGMLLGDDENMDEGAIEDFRRSGLLHIMAVSGENVVLLCSLAGAALGALRLTLRTRLCLLLPLIAGYVVLTGCSPSIVRAGVAGGIMTLAGLVSRPTDRVLLVLAPAAVLLLLNPWNLLDAGFQLSFAAVIGLFVLGGRLQSLLGRLPRVVAEPAALTTAASIATAPVSLVAFGQTSLVGVAANVAGGFVLGPVMLLGMLSIIAGLVLPEVSTVLNVLAGLLISFLLEVAHVCAWLPLAVYQWRGPSLAFLLVAGALGLLLVLQHLAARAGVSVAAFARARRRRSAVVLAAATFVALALVLAPAGPRAPAAPTLTILDVGEGAAALLQAPDQPTVLVDAGPEPLLAALQAHAVKQIDLLILSHGHADHTRGLADVLGSVNIVRALLPQPPTPDASLDRLERELESHGARVTRCRTPLALDGEGYLLQVLPTAADGAGGDRNQDENDCALVAVVTLGAERFLLPGDVEGEALDAVVDGAFAAVELPHHGSADGFTDGLLAELAPKLAVVSVGPNSYGHPTAEALEQLQAAGVTCMRTDRHGEIAFSLDAGGQVLCAAAAAP